MPGPVAGNSDSVVPAGCPEDLWINYRKLQKCKCNGVVMKIVCAMQADKLISMSSQAAVQRRGNETELFEQDIAAMGEAQQEEEDEQCEAEEVSDKEFDEIYRIAGCKSS